MAWELVQVQRLAQVCKHELPQVRVQALMKPLVMMEKKSQRDGTILSANENTISDDDMQRVTELFIEDFTNYIISHGYQYSLHFMGYALNKDYVFIDILAFDFKLCLYALSSYLTENYPDVISLQASLLIKGSTSATIDFVKEL